MEENEEEDEEEEVDKWVREDDEEKAGREEEQEEEREEEQDDEEERDEDEREEAEAEVLIPFKLFNMDEVEAMAVTLTTISSFALTIRLHFFAFFFRISIGVQSIVSPLGMLSGCIFDG